MNKKRKQHDDEEHIDETWLIPYADLLTLLLALFIVLFASSQIDAAKFNEIKISFNDALNQSSGVLDQPGIAPAGPVGNSGDDGEDEKEGESEMDEQLQQAIMQEIAELEALKEQLDQYIQQNGLNSQLETKLTNERLMITIRNHALFDSGSARVRSNAQTLAVAISEMLVQYPDYEIVIAGHTDNRPINTPQFESNWDLSVERALNFMKILLENEEITPARFSATGYGEYRPIADNQSVEGRQQNRRVEISIMRNFTESGSRNLELEQMEN